RALLTGTLDAPRVVWLMVPAGEITSATIDQLLTLLEPGDTIIDGGNSNYKDSQARYALLRERGIAFLDAGTSGGVWGLKEGYCLMVGGDREAFTRVEPALKTLAPENGYAHVGPAGAGHFVKMVHNAIEYGMLEAYAEGFEMMHARDDFSLDLKQVADLWNQGSVVRSWLLELAAQAFTDDPGLDAIKGYVDDTGEGRWAVLEAIEHDIPAPVITLSLLQRFRSRQDDSFSARTIAALRNQFGGHATRKRG
ncbi:MAG: phosphogluconate dehydrogenase (NAD(+)-dependent, decarboxylating), partial [Thermoleophilia bacterium]